MRALTDSEVLVADKLFATLDTRCALQPEMPEIAHDWISRFASKSNPYRECLNSNCRRISAGRPQR